MPWYLPIVHPSAIVRGQWHEEPAQVSYLKRLVSFHHGWRPLDVEKPPADCIVRPSIAMLVLFDQYIQEGQWDCLSIDIENAGDYIILVGLTLMDLEAGLVGPSLSLPFKGRFGERYWSRPDHDRAVEMFGDWLADPRLAKVWQNGISHDVPMLEATGFEVNGEQWDTMVMSHYCYPEMRKGLQYNATLHLGMGNWKTMLDEDDEDEGKA